MTAEVFIPLTQGKVTVIDFEEFDERVRPYKWCVCKKDRQFYAYRGRRKSDGPGPHSIYLHRVITNCPQELEPDHKDGDGLNNRRQNLVVGTHKQNCQSFKGKQKGATSKFRGVCWDKNKDSWQARIKKDSHHIFLGRFDSEEAAARAYDKKVTELGLSKAALNFPENL